jgi:hypothetical protein
LRYRFDVRSCDWEWVGEKMVELEKEMGVGREVDISLDGRDGARTQTALCRAAGRRFRPIILQA